MLPILTKEFFGNNIELLINEPLPIKDLLPILADPFIVAFVETWQWSPIETSCSIKHWRTEAALRPLPSLGSLRACSTIKVAHTKTLSGKKAETSQFGASTISEILRSTATEHKI